MHLAEINVARLRHPLDDPRVADFVANLDRVNALAERSDGFLWRLKDETGNATAIEKLFKRLDKTELSELSEAVAHRREPPAEKLASQGWTNPDFPNHWRDWRPTPGRR